MRFIDRLRALLRSRLVVLVLVVGAVFLLNPKRGKHEVSIHYRVPRCAERSSVAVHHGDALLRSQARALQGEDAVKWTLDLPEGEYLLRFQLDCSSTVVETERKLRVGGDENEISFDLSSKCACTPVPG